MNLKVRNRFAVAAVGALACSLASAPLASAAPVAENSTSDDQGLTIVTGEFEGRIAGQSRFGTAVAASKAAKDIGNTVILANSTAWSDTLAATPLADILNAPVLYTHRDKLEDVTIAELQRLQDDEGVTDVVLVGGELVIQPAVAAQLDDMGFTVDRIGGTSRYDTALLLAAEAVDYYEDRDGDLASDRAEIAKIKAAEAAFHTALAKWEAARGVTDARYQDLVAVQEALAEANGELAELTEDLVDVPSTTVETPYGDRDISSLEAYNNWLVSVQDRAEDAETVRAFIDARIAEYAEVKTEGFQDDSYNDLVAFHGATVYTLDLNAGEFTGTLDELDDAIRVLDFAQIADWFDGSDTLKDVQENLEWIRDANEAYAAAIRQSYGAIVLRIVEIAEANENNAALMEAIADQQREIDDLEEDLAEAEDALEEARAAEGAAWAAFEAAAEARPLANDDEEALAEYNSELASVLDDGTKYPAFLATGLDFPDALAAGPAAAAETGVILLTRGTAVPDATQRYLDEDPNTVAVGGPAAAAVDADVEYVGYSRYETATEIAAAYFTDPSYVGLASGAVAADAVIGGALMANVDGTLVLTRHNALPDTTRDFLSYKVDEPHLVVFGGPLAISEAAEQAAVEALGN